MLDRAKPVCVLGSSGMVGSAVVRRLRDVGFEQVCEAPGRIFADLRDPTACKLLRNPYSAIFNCAAVVGGIRANLDRPATFIYDNLQMTLNILCEMKMPGTKLIQFGSSCMYPAKCEQPMRETALLTGKPEPTNRPYAIAKLAALTLAQAHHAQYGYAEAEVITLIPPNLYGPGDNYDPRTSHVVAAMIRRFHEAKVHNDSFVINWGDGTAVREFMYVDDLATVALHAADNYHSARPLNVGTNRSLDLRRLAQLVAEVVGFEGLIRWDNDERLNGMRVKQMDSSRAHKLGWKPKVSLREGLEYAYADYLDAYGAGE